MLKKVFVAFLWEWAPQHSFAICSQKKLMPISALYNTLVESLYIKFQPTNSRVNSNQKMYFWNQKLSHSNFSLPLKPERLLSSSFPLLNNSMVASQTTSHRNSHCQPLQDLLWGNWSLCSGHICFSLLSILPPSLWLFCPLNTDLPLWGNKTSPTPRPKGTNFFFRLFFF